MPVVEVLDHARFGLAAHRAPQDDLCPDSARTCAAPVGGVEDARAQALRSLFQRIKEHALAVFMIAVALRQKKCLIVEDFFIQRPSIFGQS